MEFRELVVEKGRLYSRKIKGVIGQVESQRLVEVSREVNRMRRRLKREYFDRRMGEIAGDLKATWEVLGEVLRGRKGRDGLACGYFEKEGMPVTRWLL